MVHYSKCVDSTTPIETLFRFQRIGCPFGTVMQGFRLVTTKNEENVCTTKKTHSGKVVPQVQFVFRCCFSDRPVAGSCDNQCETPAQVGRNLECPCTTGEGSLCYRSAASHALTKSMIDVCCTNDGSFGSKCDSSIPGKGCWAPSRKLAMTGMCPSMAMYDQESHLMIADDKYRRTRATPEKEMVTNRLVKHSKKATRFSPDARPSPTKEAEQVAAKRTERAFADCPWQGPGHRNRGGQLLALKRNPVPIASGLVEDCSVLCARTDDCNGFAFYAPGDPEVVRESNAPNAGSCYLKYGVLGVVKDHAGVNTGQIRHAGKCVE